MNHSGILLRIKRKNIPVYCSLRTLYEKLMFFIFIIQLSICLFTCRFETPPNSNCFRNEGWVGYKELP